MPDVEADAAAPSAAVFYARALPLLTAALVAWFAWADAAFELKPRERQEPEVSWGFRSLTSAGVLIPEEASDRAYAEAAEQIRAFLADAEASTGLTPAQRHKAEATEAAYSSLDSRGSLALWILVIGGLFLLAAAALPRFSVSERARLVLLGVAVVAVGLFWFRWCFAQVADAMAYASEGRYGLSTESFLLLVGMSLAALVAAALWLAGRRSGD